MDSKCAKRRAKQARAKNKQTFVPITPSKKQKNSILLVLLCLVLHDGCLSDWKTN